LTKRRADHWGQTPAVEVRRFLLAVVTRITVKDDAIEILMSRRGLTDALLGTDVPDLPMLKAIARARDWYEKLTSGEVDSLQTIAKQTSLGKRYVSRIFQCAFLAPDIVEAILEGRQPPELTLERLRHPLPVSWTEQRRVLGFAKG